MCSPHQNPQHALFVMMMMAMRDDDDDDDDDDGRLLHPSRVIFCEKKARPRFQSSVQVGFLRPRFLCSRFFVIAR